MTLAVLAVLGATALAANRLRTSQDASDGGSQRPIPVAGLPGTFTGGAVWQATVAAGSTIDAGDPGVAIVGRVDGGGYAVAVLDAQTGRSHWVSGRIQVSSPPRVRFTYDDGRPWLVAYFGEAGNVVVLVFDAYAQGSAVQPIHARTFEGANGIAPTVAVTDRGVLVAGTKGGAAYLYRSASGVAQLFGVAGQVPVRSYGTSALVTFSGGFGLTAEKGGWLAKDHVPNGAAAAEPRVVGVGEPLVAAVWNKSGGGQVLALHDVYTGSVKATLVVPSGSPVPAGLPCVVARDGAWATYGPWAFNLGTGTATALPGGGVYEFTQIHDGVAYGTGRSAGQSSPTASPTASRTGPGGSSGPTGSSKPTVAPSSAAPTPAGTKPTAVAVDLWTGQPLDGGSPALVPAEFDGYGHGLFVQFSAGDADGVLYAAPLKRWRP